MTGQRASSKILREKWDQDPDTWPPGIWFCSSMLRVQFPTGPCLSPKPRFYVLLLSLLSLFLSVRCPLFFPSLPNLSQLAPNSFCWGLLKTRCYCLFTPFLWASCFLPEIPSELQPANSHTSSSKWYSCFVYFQVLAPSSFSSQNL